MRRESRASASGTAVPAHRGAGSSVVPARLGLALLALLGVGLLCLPSQALAAKKYQPFALLPPNYPDNETWTPREFSTLRPDSVAVSDKNHHIYVADSGRGAVYDFSAVTDETPERWNGDTTLQGSFGAGVVAVAADNSTGDVYVADRSHAVIDKFDAGGTLINEFGDTEPTANGQLAGLETAAKSFSPSTGQYSGFGIAVDQATHDLYVLDAGHEVIDIFNEEGELVTEITDKPEGLYDGGGAYASGIAVSSAGNVYVSSWEGPNRIFQFGPSNSYVSTWDGGQLPNGAASETPDGNFSPPYTGCCLVSAGVEDSTGHVFVADFHYLVNVFDANGNFIPPQLTRADVGSEYLGYPDGVTIDQETGYLYVSQYSQVQVFKPVIVPDVSVNAASGETTTSATLSGHVDPATGEGGGPITECRFEYLSLYQFAENGESHPWNSATQVPCSPTPSNSPTDVSATVTGLSPGLEYKYRLVAANAEGGNSLPAPVFATVGHYRYSSDFGSLGSGDGQLKEPLDVAVNNGSGDIYVADSGNHRVDQFSSGGDFIRAFGADVGGAGIGVCSSGCQAGSPGTAPGQLSEPKFIEVDNSNGPSGGDVYVADGGDRIVQKFDSSGNLIASWGNGGEIQFPVREGTIGGISVDPVGNLYVLTDSAPYNWTVFSQDGLSRKQYPTNGEWFGGERLQLGTPAGSGIEVGPDDNWYETTANGDGVTYSSPTASIYNTEGVYKPVNIELVNSGLTFDRATHDLFVAQGGHIDRFAAGACADPDVGCKPTDSFGSGQLGFAAGLASRPSSHLLYAADKGKDNVAVFSPMPLPDVTTGPATEIEPTAGTMTGHVDPLGGTIDSCEFEYLEGPVRDEVQILKFSENTKEGTFTLTFEGQTTVPIQFEHSFFEADTIEFRLNQLSTIGTGGVHVAEFEEGLFEVEFTGKFSDLNIPPMSADGSGLAPAGATLTAETRYDGNGWTYSVTTPCTPAAPISAPTDVSARLTNLTPFNTYHYRLMASRADGEGLVSYGEERGFTPTPTDVPSVDGTSSGGVTPTSATLSAEINPNQSPTVYRFQYGTDTTYGSQTPSSTSIGEDNVDHSVGAEVTELAPGRTYHYRVLATNLNGSTAGPDETFSTPDRPAVAAASASDITPTGATLSARIRPGFMPTTYHFEYGRTAAFGVSTSESPSIGADDSIHTASTAISGLLPGTTYHFRIVASNAIGIADSAEQEFTTASEPQPAPAKEPAACRTGFVKRHGKCVKKKHHKHRTHRHGKRAGRG